MLSVSIIQDPLFNRVFMSVFFALVLVFPLSMMSKIKAAGMNAKKCREKQEIAKQKAIAKGHVIKARYKKTKFANALDDSDSASGQNTIVYTYKYKGIRYKYRIHEDITDGLLNIMGYEIKLYFLYYPWRAAPEGHLNTSRVIWPLVWLVAAVAIFVLTGG